MGKYRSRSGCLTCRARRVKCDETHPVCKACSKKNRPCQWEAPHTKFKDYQPSDGASSKSAVVDGGSENMELDETDDEGSLASRSTSPRTNEGESRPGATSDNSTSRSTSDRSPNDSVGIHSPGSPFTLAGPRLQNSISVASLLRQPIPDGIQPYSQDAISLTHVEARLVHYYSENLGSWLDCTDATRQFTLGVPEKVKHSPVLCHAVVSFAARHRREDAVAEAAYQRCIALLIERLGQPNASHDETLLCTIVVLRFYEQLNASTTGSDAGQHLAGCSAILRASQGNHYVDPSAPTLREAAFWVYVRQCLYTATINQQPPDVDFSLQLHPTPGSMQDSHPLARLRLETAWANQMTWNTALIVNFCFEADPTGEQNVRLARWDELWKLVQAWARDRPAGFDPIWHGSVSNDECFPQIWFTADWHAVAFCLYHFACIMLHSFRPGPRFAIRSIGSLTNTDRQILEHAHAICGACRSTPKTMQLSIILCHTIFIWGPLVTEARERDEVVQLLSEFEKLHVWPTAWIISALTSEWGS